MLFSKKTKLSLIAVLLTVIAAGTLACASDPPQPLDFIITNPYADVDWDAFSQYKAALHVHTTHSDGRASLPEMVREHYALGFDILAITDHDVLTLDWYYGPYGFSFSRTLEADDVAAIIAGTYAGTYAGTTRPQSTGMIYIPNTNEQSATNHMNTYFTFFNNERIMTQEEIILNTQVLGGLTIINHKGRYSGGVAGGEAGAAASNDPELIARYVDWYYRYSTLLGMELFNKLDSESRSDRILWDNILMELMPQGRFVWGFGNDDSHSLTEIGYSWTVLLMPELNIDAARVAMETGASYAVSRVCRTLDINTVLEDGRPTPEAGTTDTLFMLQQPTPSIARIVAEDNQIIITARDYDRIEWIADGQVIYTGATLNLLDHNENINSYVRAQIISETGVALTQPFGIRRVGSEFVNDMYAILPVHPVANVPNGAPKTAEGLQLPQMAQLLMPDDSIIFTGITWHVEHANYDPAISVAQEFTVSGTVRMPNHVTNTSNVSTTVYTHVSVAPAQQVITVAELGDVWWWYGRSDATFFEEAFDMDARTGWTRAMAPIGFGSPGVGEVIRIVRGIAAGEDSSQRGAPDLHTWTYFKTSFELPLDFSTEGLINVFGTHEIHGALILYVNGIEVYRFNAFTGTSTEVSIGGNIDWDRYAGLVAHAMRRPFSINEDFNNRDTRFVSVDAPLLDAGSRSNLAQALRPGTNILTAAVGQTGSDSDAFWFNLSLALGFED